MQVLVFWSGGKDSAWALHRLRLEGHDVVALLTTFDQATGRVLAHGVRRAAIRSQAAAVGLPLIEVDLPARPSDAMYRFAIGAALDRYRASHRFDAIGFGDLQVAGVRAVREELAHAAGLTPLFPLWGIRTDLLARSMLATGIAAHLVAVDAGCIDPRWAGHPWDHDWIESLPSTVDPCGENGEFHTLVTAGPMFERPLELTLAGTVERDGYAYADFTVELAG